MTASLQDISVRFGRRWVLVRLSLDIPPKATTLVTGPNGAGKTTMLRVLATVQRPTRGQVQLFGQEVGPNPDPLRARIGLLTHQTYLYDDLSAAENLRLVTRLAPKLGLGLTPALERVGLAEHAHRPVRQFSAGMKRRLCLARLLVRAPELVLLDEPFGRLDPEGLDLVEDIIGDLRRRGVTVVLASHDLIRGRRLADHHITMAVGRITGQEASAA